MCTLGCYVDTFFIQNYHYYSLAVFIRIKYVNTFIKLSKVVFKNKKKIEYIPILEIPLLLIKISVYSKTVLNYFYTAGAHFGKHWSKVLL